MKKVLIISCCLLFVIGCSKSTTYEYKKINSESEKLEIMKNNSYQIIDVRSSEEYEMGHMKDAINIEYTKVNTIKLKKNTVLFVYCASGKRSKIAAETLLQMGYQVYDLGAYSS